METSGRKYSGINEGEAKKSKKNGGNYGERGAAFLCRRRRRRCATKRREALARTKAPGEEDAPESAFPFYSY